MIQRKKCYAVFGLGRYGITVAKELVENGAEVIAVDIDRKIVNDAAAFLPVCKCADVTDAEVISRLGIGGIDTVVICMASNLEASVMAIALCKEAGARRIIAKCANETHGMILSRVGADKVVFPEKESGIRLAKNMLCSGFIDMVSLSDDVSVVEIKVKDEWVGKNLIELKLRKSYGFNVVAVKKGEALSLGVNPEEPLDPESILIVISDSENLRKYYGQ